MTRLDGVEVVRRAVSLAHLRNNRFLAAWFGGSAEGADDVGIWVADRFQGAWSPPRLAAKTGPIPHWNPVLHRTADRAVRLNFRVGRWVAEWRTWFSDSTDEGRTWSSPAELGAGDPVAPGPVRHPPLVLADGTWLAGNSIETDDDWRLVADRSSDGGRTWTHGALLGIEDRGDGAIPSDADRAMKHLRPVLSFAGRGAIQPGLWASGPRNVHLLGRSTAGALYRSDSDDGGRTWCPLYRTELPNNNSAIDVIRLSDGTLVLASNPVGENWGARTPLRVSLSFDNGATWPHFRDLESDAGEYSYPALAATPRGIAVVYTWRRERIAFWHGSVEQIIYNDAISRHTQALHSGVMP